MKIFKHRNLMGCIYSLILALPLLAVLATSAYVVVNKNAYQSYTNITQTITTNITQSNYNSQTVYNFKYIKPSNTDSSVVGMSYISLTPSDLGISQSTYESLTEWSIRSGNRIWFGDGTTHNIVVKSLTETCFANFDMMANLIPQSFNVFDITFVQNLNGTLDNVFEYSLDKVITDNNFGNIDFLSWFDGMFLADNQVNNRYVHYVNWYLNYTLFVSLAYILFLVLMWFVNFSRRLLERGMNYDW